MSLRAPKEQSQEPGSLSRQSTMKAVRVPQSTPDPFQSNGPASTYHPLSDLGPPPETPLSDRFINPTNATPTPNYPEIPHSGPAQLLMSRLYNKPENNDVLLNIRRQEQMRMRGPNMSNMVRISAIMFCGILHTVHLTTP